MSELQDALDFWDETIGPTESLLPNTTKTIVNAARQVANPDKIIHGMAGYLSACDEPLTIHDLRMAWEAALTEPQ